mmetsp:Transcript_2477/g.5631  ORF Transcript_2477/g.5631 Transcript_2477/m.5631 type:complete len:299 (+) Transcript_2477:686-1582(+)
MTLRPSCQKTTTDRAAEPTAPQPPTCHCPGVCRLHMIYGIGTRTAFVSMLSIQLTMDATLPFLKRCWSSMLASLALRPTQRARVSPSTSSSSMTFVRSRSPLCCRNMATISLVLSWDSATVLYVEMPPFSSFLTRPPAPAAAAAAAAPAPPGGSFAPWLLSSLSDSRSMKGMPPWLPGANPAPMPPRMPAGPPLSPPPCPSPASCLMLPTLPTAGGPSWQSSRTRGAREERSLALCLRSFLQPGAAAAAAAAAPPAWLSVLLLRGLSLGLLCCLGGEGEGERRSSVVGKKRGKRIWPA